MHKEIKKLTRSIYTIIIAIVVALLILLWFFTRSFLTFQISPLEAKVYFDGHQIRYASSGVVKITTTPGEHSVRVEAENYIGSNQTISFPRGFSKTYEIVLKETPKPIEISTNSKMLAKGIGFNENFYLGDNGKVIYKLRLGFDEANAIKIVENRPVTGPVLSGIKDIIWSPTKELALFRKEGKVTLFDFKKYDFVNQTETDWGKDIGAIAWSPDNSKIAYSFAPTDGEKSLIFANLTNTEMTRVLNFKELDINNPLLHWSPDSEWLLIIPRNTDASKNKIYLLNAYTRQLSELTDTGNQIDASFSPDGNKIIYSTYSKDSSTPVTSLLSVMDKDGQNKTSLNLRADLSKIVWVNDSKNIVAATYDQASQKESIFRFDIIQKAQSGFILKNLGENIYMYSISISDDSKIIVYQDNQGIYSVKID